MNDLGELRVLATVENLRTLSAFVGAIAERLELTEKVAFDLELALDEAATNVVKHAYPEGEPGLMAVHADVIEDVVRLTLMDWGAPFNPENIRPFDLNAPIETRIRGGMGLYFIYSLMDQVSRTTAPKPGGPNTLTLMKRIERLEPGAHRSSVSRELNAIINVSQVISNYTDLDRLLDRIVEELVDAIDAERGVLYLMDEAKGDLFSRILLEDSEVFREIRVKIGEGLVGQVAETGKIINVCDVAHQEAFGAEYDAATGFITRSMLAAPMRDQHGSIVGVVQVLNKQGGEFSLRDERLLQAMAAQATISVVNARLYEQEMAQELLNRELEAARTIQKSFLPEEVPQHEGWNIAAYWHPMREVAGDFYDFRVLPDGRLAVVIADVSGKGYAAALFMALSVTVVRFAMSLNFTPAEMMRHANTAMLEDQQSRMFTTAFVGYLDFFSGEMQYACAGHNPPLLYRHATGTVEQLTAPGVAIGVFKQAQFVEKNVQLQPGDVLVLYTDGITEVINVAEEEFGEKNLEEVVIAHVKTSAQQIVDAIMSAVSDFSADMGAFDDETLIVLKRDI